MTPVEVRAVLARLSAAYGRRPAGPDAVAEWERALRSYPASDAHATLDRLIDQGEPGPSLPAFVAHVRALQPPLLLAVPTPAGADDDDGPPGEGPTERGRAFVAAAWAALRDAPEWHRNRDTGRDPWLNDTDTTPDAVTNRDST